ncbi:unnamed protein product [Clonostachys rosea f. rosea IK726]|uniref:GDT1 family protein n=3 Tax=Bionectria ochroleuca TaxID=29856 RepID=A0A0B7KK14_BIOOC|nr:unnamed protein product [Clonostachys rosea f. rosea IK726]
MKFRSQHSSLLLLLLPALASALAAEASPSVNNINTRHDVPTKDAPVDGKDGKPHLGPFVEADEKRTNDVQDLPPLKGRPDDWTKHDGQEIPQTNDGVMFDKNRERPAKGKTGTEGGVSEKEKNRKAREDKIGGKLQQQPESPKEQPPLPHSEEQKIQSTTSNKKKDSDSSKSAPSTDKSKDTTYTGLDKPDDLPDTPHKKTQTTNSDDIDLSSKPPSTPNTNSKITPHGDEEDGIIQPFHSFILSLTMILFSEVGDKTFLVAALMAMKHDRMVVFSAAFGALFVMTVLSAVLGHTVPTLLPKRLTSLAASILFFVFGAKLLHEGLQMDPNEGVGAEMSEVEQELAMKEKEHQSDSYSLEMGLPNRRPRSRSQMASPPRSPSQSPSRPAPRGGAFRGFLHGTGNLLSLLLSPAWVQTFVMTFLGEWGDRSQIATIAMAAGQDYWWVTLGAVCGHAVCTGAAVIGGRAIAGRVSLKVVTVGGAVAFLVFGLIYLIESFYT